MTTVQNILNSELIALTTVFFNIVEETEDEFIVRSNYRKSTKVSIELDESLSMKNNTLLNDFTGLNFDHIKKGTHELRIKKDINVNFNDFTNQLHSKIQQYRFVIEKEAFDRAIILGAFIPRGSMDFTATYCAVDIYERFSTKSYTEQILNLLMSTNSMSQLNLNFRQLQNQYVKNENKRNTQLRINLKWLNDLYVSYIKSMNYYKYLILTENKDILAYSNYNSESTKFLERTVFYIENIINPNFSFELMSDKEKNRQVTSLREELSFSNQEKTLIDKSRNSKIITIANALLPEECVCCKDQYNIEDRTFKRRGTDKYYFELHHVISFGSNKSGDILENLVKLCPACHRALTPNRSESKYQKNLIKNILINSKSARDYVANFVSDPNDLNTKIEYVFSHLK